MKEAFDPKNAEGFNKMWDTVKDGFDKSQQIAIQGSINAGRYEEARQKIIAESAENIIALDRALAAERAQLERQLLDQIAQRSREYGDRLFAALTDTTTLEGALAAFDRNAQKQREDEIKAGGEAIANLDIALAAERLKLIRDFNDRALAEEKRAAEEQLRVQTRE
jgi:hypothetical protein